MMSSEIKCVFVRPISFVNAYIFIALFTIALFVIVWHSEAITTLQAALGLTIIIMGALPSVVHYYYKFEQELIPLLPLHGIFYITAFGIPIFLVRTDWRDVSVATLDYALFLTLLGLIVLYCGYYGSRRLLASIQPIHIVNNVTDKRLVNIGWLLYGFYLVFQFNPSLLELPSISQLSEPLGYFSIGLLFSLMLHERLSKVNKILLVSLAIPFTFIVKLTSGSLAFPVFFCIFLGLLFWNIRRRIPWGFMIPILLIAVLINPVKHEYRKFAWHENNLNLSYFDKASLFYEVIADYYSGGPITEALSTDESTINRLAHISTFAYVVQETPESVPYWMGSSYETLFSSFIPRFLWQDKPQATIGQDFGHRYDFISPSDYLTSFNLPWLTEFYANFGFIGVIVGMLLVGILFSFLIRKFSCPPQNVVESVLGTTLIFQLFYAESNLSLMIGGILLTYISFYIFLRFLSREFSF
jgi:hypothetical protein